MEKKIIYQFDSLYRDTFRVTGFEFGEGEKSACIVGNTRGNEYQQVYTCARLVQKLKQLEEQGKIKKGHKILVIPSANPYSANVQKRFWPTDNTDINRMFPGYDLGETTQRIAAGVFEEIKDYEFGMQFSSYYMPGKFIPHVRMMKTGFEETELAKDFGFPYVMVRNVRPYDTGTLNYNWQIWETKAFSIYTDVTTEVHEESAKEAIKGILRFLAKQGIIEYTTRGGFQSTVLTDVDLKSARTHTAGIFECVAPVGTRVEKGQVIARVLDPLDAEVKEELVAPVAGLVFFAHNDPLTYADTAVIKIIVEEE